MGKDICTYKYLINRGGGALNESDVECKLHFAALDVTKMAVFLFHIIFERETV